MVMKSNLSCYSHLQQHGRSYICSSCLSRLHTCNASLKTSRNTPIYTSARTYFIYFRNHLYDLRHLGIMAGGTHNMSLGSDKTTIQNNWLSMKATVHPTANLSILTTTEIPNVIVKVSSTAETVIAAYMGFLVFFGIFNNSIVLFLYYKYKNLHNPVNLFLINISISDLTVSVFGSPFMFASTIAGHWLFGDAGCSWYAFITTLGGK